MEESHIMQKLALGTPKQRPAVKPEGVISCLCRNAEAADGVGKYGENRKYGGC